METRTLGTGLGKKLPQQILAKDMRQRSNEPLWISPELARALAECERVHTHAGRRKQKPCAVAERMKRWGAAVILCIVLLFATHLIGAALEKAGKKAIERHIDRILLELSE